jgi:hypothetical protein
VAPDHIVLTGLPPHTHRNDVFECFRHYGLIRYILVVRHEVKSECAGRAYVRFFSAKCAALAARQGVTVLLGEHVTIRLTRDAPLLVNCHPVAACSHETPSGGGMKRSHDTMREVDTWRPPLKKPNDSVSSSRSSTERDSDDENVKRRRAVWSRFVRGHMSPPQETPEVLQTPVIKMEPAR